MNRINNRSISILFIVCILFIISNICVFADNIDNKELVHKNKVWKFVFKEEIEFEDLNKDYIFVKNSDEQVVEVELELEDNKRTLFIKPPKEGYRQGEEYTLFISTNIGSNDKITNYLTREFVIEEEKDKNTSIKVNTVSKDIIFDKQTFSVKEYDWLSRSIEYDISLEDVVIGEDAWSIIRKSNRFNSKPAKGKEYILAKFNINLNKAGGNRFVKFDKKMFKIVSDNNTVYDPYERSIVLNEELDNKLIEGEECSGWIAGYIDKEDNPSIVMNKGKDSEISFKIEKHTQKSEKENLQEKEIKENTEQKNDIKEILTKEELFKYLDEYKVLLIKEMINNKEFEKNILDNYTESNKITDKENVLFDLKNNNIFDDNNIDSNDKVMRYLYQILSE